jgi:hypothetical protein
VILTPVPLILLSLHAFQVSDGIVRGECIEARTASVFAGACHYGAEATTSGREAILALRFESGVHGGIDLSGVEVAAAVAGDANLSEPAAARRSILYFSDAAAPAAIRAAEDLLRLRFGPILGTITEERSVPLRVRSRGRLQCDLPLHGPRARSDLGAPRREQRLRRQFRDPFRSSGNPPVRPSRPDRRSR